MLKRSSRSFFSACSVLYAKFWPAIAFSCSATTSSYSAMVFSCSVRISFNVDSNLNISASFCRSTSSTFRIFPSNQAKCRRNSLADSSYLSAKSFIVGSGIESAPVKLASPPAFLICSYRSEKLHLSGTRFKSLQKISLYGDGKSSGFNQLGRVGMGNSIFRPRTSWQKLGMTGRDRAARSNLNECVK